MVDPATAVVASPVILGFAWGAHLWSKYGHKKTRNVGVVGMWASGKSTFEHCMRVRKGNAVYDFQRKETLEAGTKYRAKIPGAKRHLKGRDYPWYPTQIAQQLDELDPSWITIWIDVYKWDQPQNWEVITEVIKWLTKGDYRDLHDPRYVSYWSPFHKGAVERRVPFTGRSGCKLVTIFLNKIDSIRHWPDFHKGEYMRQIGEVYLKDDPTNPLMHIKGKIEYEFVGVSLYDGLCYKYPRFHGDGIEFKDYIAEVTRKL